MANRTPYVLTRAASADLRAIARYTLKEWGVAQTHAYTARLKEGMAALDKGEGLFKELSDIHPQLRVSHRGHHYIFCLIQEQPPALVVALLHERMDILVRLKTRLEDTP